ncbi:MAG: hypothetical protein AB1546_10225, partial [bacterium]
GRPHVHDVAAALGGGAQADTEHLRFAPFDLLQDSDEDATRLPFVRIVERLRKLFGDSERLRPVDFRCADGADAVAALFNEWVIRGGAEGIVVRCADGRIVKIKSEITIDAAVVGLSEYGTGRIGRLLLALMRTDGRFQMIGSVGTGWTEEQRTSLHSELSNEVVPSSYRKVTREGALYRFVRPRLVVEVQCNDLLTHHSDGSPIRRMALDFSKDSGWTPLRNAPIVSMINTVFVRIRDDKAADPVAVRLSQITNLVLIEDDDMVLRKVPMPVSQVLHRSVYTKVSGAKTLVRKMVVWKTNKESIDSAYPSYIAFFTDFSPSHAQPLKTDIRIATTRERIDAHAEAWLADNIKRG